MTSGQLHYPCQEFEYWSHNFRQDLTKSTPLDQGLTLWFYQY